MLGGLDAISNLQVTGAFGLHASALVWMIYISLLIEAGPAAGVLIYVLVQDARLNAPAERPRALITDRADSADPLFNPSRKAA
jgi:hypothetical protein